VVHTKRSLVVTLPMLLVASFIDMQAAYAASAREIDRGANKALSTLYAAQPKARDLARRAKAILMFPKIIKAGLLIGGQSGDGCLRVGSQTVGYYNIAAG